MSKSTVMRLCLRYMDRADVQSMSLTCRELNSMAREEMRHRTYALASLAYTCIRQHAGMLVMAGSMPLWLSSGGPDHWFPSDVDLFWYGGEDLTVKIDNNEVCCILFDADGSTYGVTFMYGIRPLVRTVQTFNGNVQFILSSHFDTIDDVLETFDLTCCRIASTRKNQFHTLDGFSTDSFHVLRCSEETVCRSGGTGQPADMVQLASLQHIRTLQRAEKYQKRGLVNAGVIEATAAVLTFCLLYIRSKCTVFEHRLDIPHPTQLRNTCVCGEDGCIVDETCIPDVVATTNNGKLAIHHI